MVINIIIVVKKTNADFQKKISYIADFTANSNSAHVWNTDYTNFQKYLDSLFIEKTLVSVIFEKRELNDAQNQRHYYGVIAGTTIDKKALNIKAVEPPNNLFTYHLKRSIIHQGLNIGTVHIYFSDKYIQSEILRKTKLIIINIIAFVIIFSTSMYFVLKIQLLTPLKKIHHLAMSISGFTTYLSESVSQERWRLVQNLLAVERQHQSRIKEKIRNDELGDFMQAFLLVFNGFEVIVSELSQYSEQLQTMNDDLEERITKRTIELETSNEKITESLMALQKTQSQLIQQEKLASIGQLAAGVAHEINNPIGYVGSNIGRLDEYFTDLRKVIAETDASLALLPKEISIDITKKITKIKKRLDFYFLTEDFPAVILDCREGIARVKEIVQGLKDFSHNVDDQDFSEVDINNVIHTTLKVVNNEIKYYCDVELDLQLDKKVSANIGQIHQVISNIVVNASYAIRETGKRGQLNIRTFSDNNFAIIEIQDTGDGIPEGMHTKIFDPFFTTKPIGQGTGLGLHISYDIIVNRHKGNLSFVSEMGIGTIFSIKVPLSNTSSNTT